MVVEYVVVTDNSDHVTDIQSSSARKGSKGDPSITRTGPRTFSHPRQSTEHNAYFYPGVLLIGSVILAAVFIIAIYLPRFWCLYLRKLLYNICLLLLCSFIAVNATGPQTFR